MINYESVKCMTCMESEATVTICDISKRLFYYIILLFWLFNYDEIVTITCVYFILLIIIFVYNN